VTQGDLMSGLTSDLLAALTAVPVSWSAMVRDAATDATLAEHHGSRVLRTASVGKLFLLLEVVPRASH